MGNAKVQDPAEPRRAPEGSAVARTTVLVVDDAPACAAALVEACAAVRGVSVLAVTSAVDAVRILRDKCMRICAVVTDIRMPGMDGFELIRFVRAERDLASTPIIVVTGDTDPETPERAASLGANACFAKPFSPGALRRTLGELLDASPGSR